MTEKRYKGNKYITCYCTKKAQVLVGSKFYAVANPLGFAISMFIIAVAFINDADLQTKIGVVALLGVTWIVALSVNYSLTKKDMIQAGHSAPCGHRVGLWVMVLGSLWSEFKIMKSKDDGKRLWW